MAKEESIPSPQGQQNLTKKFVKQKELVVMVCWTVGEALGLSLESYKKDQLGFMLSKCMLCLDSMRWQSYNLKLGTHG